MDKKIQLSHNPSFDLDFIGKVVHTESSIKMKRNSTFSLPKISSKILEGTVKDIIYTERAERKNNNWQKSGQDGRGDSNVRNGSLFVIKMRKKSNNQQCLAKRKIQMPQQMKNSVSVRKYGKWI